MTKVKLNTSLGDITIKLEDELTPKTVENFLHYVKEGFYNDTLFHRIIDGFMVQGGGLTSGMKTKTTQAPIINEAQSGLPNEPGTIAMARTNDPHSASSQFFINVANNSFLNFRSESIDGFGYCAFGRVTEGMDVVNAMSKVPTTNRAGHGDVPVDEVQLMSAEILP